MWHPRHPMGKRQRQQTHDVRWRQQRDLSFTLMLRRRGGLLSVRLLLTVHLPLCAPENVLGCGFCDLLLTSVMTPLQDHPRHLGLVSAFWVHHDCCAARRLSGSEIWHLHLGQGCGWELVGRVENCFWHLGLCFGFRYLLMSVILEKL